MSTDHTASIHAELAIIRARMQAVLTMLPVGECPIVATDALYGRQEELKAMLWDEDTLNFNRYHTSCEIVYPINFTNPHIQ
jgi:hypothetical protein